MRRCRLPHKTNDLMWWVGEAKGRRVWCHGKEEKGEKGGGGEEKNKKNKPGCAHTPTAQKFRATIFCLRAARCTRPAKRTADLPTHNRGFSSSHRHTQRTHPRHPHTHRQGNHHQNVLLAWSPRGGGRASRCPTHPTGHPHDSPRPSDPPLLLLVLLLIFRKPTSRCLPERQRGERSRRWRRWWWWDGHGGTTTLLPPPSHRTTRRHRRVRAVCCPAPTYPPTHLPTHPPSFSPI